MSDIVPLASPPVVIGPFDNVPAPGSPIRSDWPQEISSYVVTLAATDNRTSARTQLRGGSLTDNGPLIMSGTAVLSTDPTGYVTVGYPVPFTANGTPVGWPAEPSFDDRFTVQAMGTTSFTMLVRNGAGAAKASSTVVVAWIAIGPRQ